MKIFILLLLSALSEGKWQQRKTFLLFIFLISRAATNFLQCTFSSFPFSILFCIGAAIATATTNCHRDSILSAWHQSLHDDHCRRRPQERLLGLMLHKTAILYCYHHSCHQVVVVAPLHWHPHSSRQHERGIAGGSFAIRVFECFMSLP